MRESAENDKSFQNKCCRGLYPHRIIKPASQALLQPATPSENSGENDADVLWPDLCLGFPPTHGLLCPALTSEVVLSVHVRGGMVAGCFLRRRLQRACHAQPPSYDSYDIRSIGLVCGSNTRFNGQSGMLCISLHAYDRHDRDWSTSFAAVTSFG